MTHFTQLGLSGNPDKKPEVKPQGKTTSSISPEAQRPRSNDKKSGGKEKTAALLGSLIATALLGVFVFESGCSKESDKAATIAPPTSQNITSQTPTPIMTTLSAPAGVVATQPPAKKTSRQRKLSASTYTNPAYGVSFRYPKYDSLREGDDASMELDGLGPLEMNFVQPGGTTISTIEMPRKLYAGTDFNSAFFNVSVNPKLTAADCQKFVFPETGDPQTDPVTTSETKVGPTSFNAVEGFAETENNQVDVKFYHVFQNGNCYEFALGLETTTQGTPDEVNPAVKPVNHNEVFRQLNWILSTVKIEQSAVAEKPVPEVASDTSMDRTNMANTEAH